MKCGALHAKNLYPKISNLLQISIINLALRLYWCAQRASISGFLIILTLFELLV